MIDVTEIRQLSAEWQVREDVVEKDYSLGWLLTGITNSPDLAGWVFKGGTCLRKCYYETYRFSEDLDFTLVPGAPQKPDDLVQIFESVSSWLYDTCGLELQVDENSFKQTKNKRGIETTTGKIAFRGPRNPPTLPKIKLDLTNDEPVISDTPMREVFHPYTDAGNPLTSIRCYSIVDLLAEKLRALAQRCRPRDLYDVVHVFRHPDLLGKAPSVRAVLEQKCKHVSIDPPTLDSIRGSKFRQEIESEWANMLAHQLPVLPPFTQFWDALDHLFQWLNGTLIVPQLARAEFGKLDEHRSAPRTMVSWRSQAPIELIRFAGANRLKVTLDYRAENGRRGLRTVEPYSLRWSRDGNLLLFVVNDEGMLRSYRVDRIVGASVTPEPFQPRFVVEF